ncbi:MAG: biotin carboxylase N-terminal domain-containing protein [Hyphomonadaceae bacterium]
MSARIRSLLVANRGEIARRIQRTARDMGIRTIAIYAEGDADAPFVREADAAIALTGRTSRETYLDVDKVLAAGARAGADAIHPGYGFLSENAGFARACIEAGLIWVGPAPDAIEAMGDKLTSKRLIEAAGVPTLPAAEVKAGDNLTAAAKKIGYPILVKASAGGGGKGMRIVAKASELSEAVEGARREAASSFGDDTIFLERYVSAARHVEIQVLGDQHGGLVHCFERECSIQRRHQKVIEEAPSPAVRPALRARMGEAAVSAARAVQYHSAGTVEFLLEGEDFYFLEMNTRLQVEHPVTEMIAGLDLVREQLRVAQGEELGFTQDDLKINGWAVEARLYAEDPSNDFLPVTGTISKFEPPAAPPARFDSGVESGSIVGVEFDPMLAKVIAHAPTRAEAALRLATVLERTRLHGLVNNRDFLVACLRHDDFLAGATTTDFIKRANPARSRTPSPEDVRCNAILVALARQAINRGAARVWPHAPSGWRNTPMPWERLTLHCNGEDIAVAYRRGRDGVFAFRVNDGAHTARALHAAPDRVEAEIDGARVAADIAKAGDAWQVSTAQGDLSFRELPRFPTAEIQGVAGGLVAPMPGRVIALHIETGQDVEKDALLLVLEAMKMEHRITAPSRGAVAEIRVAVGDQVATGELLVVLAEENAEATA